MHIPDGFLNAKVAGACVALAVTGLGTALGRNATDSLRHRVPLLGVTAAFVFAAQMVSFPVMTGASGHLVGAVLATALLGIRPAMIVMTSVLLAQCLLFGDGGLLALGANVLNMGIVEPLVGGLLIAVLGGGSAAPRRRLAALACAAWSATVTSALFCAGELALSGTAPAVPLFLAMGGLHALIGVGEALISMLIMAGLLRMRPELVVHEGLSRLRPRQVIAYGFVFSAGLALLVAPFGYESPDGLGRVARWMGFDHRAAETQLVQPLLGGYRLPGVVSPALATGLAGIVGAVFVYCGAWLLGKWLAPSKLQLAPPTHSGQGLVLHEPTR